jgi:hypothetical protein
MEDAPQDKPITAIMVAGFVGAQVLDWNGIADAIKPVSGWFICELKQIRK